jgi:hypothetical protein
MSEAVGVQSGRVCPACGREDSVPMVYGLPSPDLMDLAERGLAVLGGCALPDDGNDVVCRSCGLEWGPDVDPTTGWRPRPPA